MMTNNNNYIRWGCVQPLTGGMYIGAAYAIGHDAEWIVSYPGTDVVKKDKDGNIVSAGNEYNLLDWLDKNNCKVPYYHFEHGMFDDICLSEAKMDNIKNGDDNVDKNTFRDLDLIVAVPVCAGLSNVTIANDDTKDKRNCNMLWIAKWVLNYCSPKAYIFENAPTLMSDRGEHVRNQLETIAYKAGYSILYYKTDTKYHNNPQKRPRTFVCFFKHTISDCYKQMPPLFNYEHKMINVRDYMNKIPSATTLDVPFAMSPLNVMLMNFIKEREGNGWRHKIPADLIKYITKNNLYDEFRKYIENCNINSSIKDKSIAFINHAEYKKSQGKNFYSTTLCQYGDNTPAVQFKSIQTMLHHDDDRLLTAREAMWLMGLPNDFELCGDINVDGAKIGQNVPVGTAKFIVSEAVRVIENWDNIDREIGNTNIYYQDNTKYEQN